MCGRIMDTLHSPSQAKGLHFKHTDNFNFWLQTLEDVGLPKVLCGYTCIYYTTSAHRQASISPTLDVTSCMLVLMCV